MATSVGGLLLAPLGVAVPAAAARRAPVAVRLALRDLGRYRARSAAALAAVGFAVFLAVLTCILATASFTEPGPDTLTYSTNQVATPWQGTRTGTLTHAESIAKDKLNYHGPLYVATPGAAAQLRHQAKPDRPGHRHSHRAGRTCRGARPGPARPGRRRQPLHPGRRPRGLGTLLLPAR